MSTAPLGRVGEGLASAPPETAMGVGVGDGVAVGIAVSVGGDVGLGDA
jgi:hypothetical protein